MWRSHAREFLRRAGGALVAIFLLCQWNVAIAESRLSEFAPRASPQEFFPQATRFGEPQGEPPILPVFATDRLLGYVYLNSDFTASTGYSGKPVRMLIGIDTEGVITGLKLVEHKEPIVLVGVPERRVVEAVNKLVGTRIGPIAAGKEHAPQPDIVGGATVTVLVMADSVVRSAVRLVRSGRLSSAQAPSAAAGPSTTKTIDSTQGEVRSWQDLLADGSIGHLHLTIADINHAFEESGNAEAAANPQSGSPDDTFIDLYAALVSVPTIGKSLLGQSGYDQLAGRLKPGQQAILVAGDGLYSFKGSGYVRGGIFDRIELLQEGSGTRFRDRNHERLGSIAAAGAPALREIGLFTVPEDFDFDPTEPWELQLLVQRSTGAREKAFLNFDLEYRLPNRYIKLEQRAPTPAADTHAKAARDRRRKAIDSSRASPGGGRAAVEADVAPQHGLGCHHRHCHRCSDGDLLLPEPARSPAEILHVGAPRLSPVHARMAGVVRQRAALRRQRARVFQFADHRFQLGVLPDIAADLHSMVVGSSRPLVLGTGPVLRMALPIRCAPGADSTPLPRRCAFRKSACHGTCTSGYGPSSTSSSCSCSGCRSIRWPSPSNFLRSNRSRPRSS